MGQMNGAPSGRMPFASSRTLPSKLPAILVTLFAIGVLMGCQRQVTEENIDIVGIWTDSAVFVAFREDGTFSFSNRAETLETSRLSYGDYEIEGNILTTFTSEEAASCAGLTETWEVELTQAGELNITPIEDPCVGPEEHEETVTWVRYSP